MSERRGIQTLLVRVSLRSVLAELSLQAEAVWHALRMYCAEVGNDGRLPKDKVLVGLSRRVTATTAAKLMAELVTAELVVEHENVFEFVAWLDENPSVDVWHDPVRRERHLRNKRLRKDSELCRRVKSRDHNLCRYCGVRVDWNNKRGPTGASYDHVDPDKDNEFENVVVACRRCNGQKRDRTPEQAGMKLLPPGTGVGSESTPNQLRVSSGVKKPSPSRETDRAESEPNRS